MFEKYSVVHKFWTIYLEFKSTVSSYNFDAKTFEGKKKIEFTVFFGIKALHSTFSLTLIKKFSTFGSVLSSCSLIFYSQHFDNMPTNATFMEHWTNMFYLVQCSKLVALVGRCSCHISAHSVLRLDWTLSIHLIFGRHTKRRPFGPIWNSSNGAREKSMLAKCPIYLNPSVLTNSFYAIRTLQF